jgi:hypothetical protein
MVCSYTGMDLTFEKDIFPALSDLAKTIQTHVRHEYCAGMWQDSLLMDMLWRLSNSVNLVTQDRRCGGHLLDNGHLLWAKSHMKLWEAEILFSLR